MKLPEIDFDSTDLHASPDMPWIVRGYIGTNLPTPPLSIYATLEEARRHHPSARLTARAEAEMERLKEAPTVEENRWLS